MIQTVTGQLNKEETGAVLMHEHISCSSLSYELEYYDIQKSHKSIGYLMKFIK